MLHPHPSSVKRNAAKKGVYQTEQNHLQNFCIFAGRNGKSQTLRNGKTDHHRTVGHSAADSA